MFYCLQCNVLHNESEVSGIVKVFKNGFHFVGGLQYQAGICATKELQIAIESRHSITYEQEV
jgi:hypothetical protein